MAKKSKQLKRLAKEEALASNVLLIQEESKTMGKIILKYLKNPTPKTLDKLEFSYKIMQGNMRVIGRHISNQKRKNPNFHKNPKK